MSSCAIFQNDKQERKFKAHYFPIETSSTSEDVEKITRDEGVNLGEYEGFEAIYLVRHGIVPIYVIDPVEIKRITSNTHQGRIAYVYQGNHPQRSGRTPIQATTLHYTHKESFISRITTYYTEHLSTQVFLEINAIYGNEFKDYYCPKNNILFTPLDDKIFKGLKFDTDTCRLRVWRNNDELAFFYFKLDEKGPSANMLDLVDVTLYNDKSLSNAVKDLPLIGVQDKVAVVQE